MTDGWETGTKETEKRGKRGNKQKKGETPNARAREKQKWGSGVIVKPVPVSP